VSSDRAGLALALVLSSSLTGGAAAGVLGAGCSPGPRGGEAVPPASASSSAPPGSPPLASARPPSPRATDPLWIRARDEDPLERARLAEAVGAAGLLLGFSDGGETAETALLAMPFADDAEIALRRLGEAALVADAASLPGLLEAIHGIAGRPARAREPLDPEGARACGEAMVSLAGRASLPRETRALAVSAARALAERGYVDRARIPAELDPN
jgi:hypothetical protein